MKLPMKLEIATIILLGCLPAPAAAGLGVASRATEEVVMSRTIDSAMFITSGMQLRSFVKSVLIDASVEDVFAAWTTTDGWSRIYGPPSSSRLELAIGGSYEWLFDGKIGSNGCQVLSYIPNRMVSFSWNAPPTQPESRARHTWVVVEVEPDGEADRTRVQLTHLGFGEGAGWDETYAYFDRAWERVLSRMQTQLSSTSTASSQQPD